MANKIPKLLHQVLHIKYLKFHQRQQCCNTMYRNVKQCVSPTNNPQPKLRLWLNIRQQNTKPLKFHEQNENHPMFGLNILL